MYSQELLTGQGLSLAEALKTGSTTTVLGLSIVFSVLIVLMIVLALFKVIFYRQPKTKNTPVPAEALSQEVPDDTDEDELIAVLTAAVAASLNTSTYNLRIKSYRRTDNKMPAWNKAGVNETINNRF